MASSRHQRHTMRILCRLMDDLDSKNKVKWEDVYNDRFGPGKDTLLQVAASACHDASDAGLEMMQLLIKGCIDRDRKDLIFVKNVFGMNLIDWLMIIDTLGYYNNRSRFAQMLIKKFEIDKQEVEVSYKKARFSREMTVACEVSDLVRIKSILDEIKNDNNNNNNTEAASIDGINMCCFSFEEYGILNVKWLYVCLFIYLSCHTKHFITYVMCLAIDGVCKQYKWI